MLLYIRLLYPIFTKTGLTTRYLRLYLDLLEVIGTTIKHSFLKNGEIYLNRDIAKSITNIYHSKVVESQQKHIPLQRKTTLSRTTSKKGVSRWIMP